MDPTQFKPKIPLQRKNSGKTNLPKSLSKLRLLSKGNKPLSMLVLGDPQVGKSSVLSKYKKNDFVNLYEASYFEYFSPYKKGHKPTNVPVQEKFEKYVNAIVIVFDVTNLSTLKHATNYWLPNVKCALPNIPIILLGNKSDISRNGSLLQNKRPSRRAQPIIFEAIAMQFDFTDFLEVSAKYNRNIDQFYDRVTKISRMHSNKEKILTFKDRIYGNKKPSGVTGGSSGKNNFADTARSLKKTVSLNDMKDERKVHVTSFAQVI